MRGEYCWYSLSAILRAVHLRMRGEYTCGSALFHTVMGTPAYVGNTLAASIAALSLAVHPRVRGEYWFSTLEDKSIMGSPPHTRGIHQRIKIHSQGARFTPACAGKRPPPFSRSCPGGFTPACAGKILQREQPAAYRQVHPRIRGEFSIII